MTSMDVLSQFVLSRRSGKFSNERVFSLLLEVVLR